MGTNYRTEWNTPIKVPVLNLSTEHGGLTPVKRGGGKQTKSLRLEDPAGRQYTLRSIAKFITSKTLPGDLQSEAAADLVSDGVSASYPYAALSIPILCEAAGIPHGTARLVYIPDDPKLGDFRKDFGNMMALYEERLPDTVQKAYDTEEVMDKLKDDNDNDVNQAALLRIRILDMFVMDLDRHEGQWTWGAYDNGKGRVFFPMAKDRDQAFYINRGVLPGLIKGKSLVPQLEGFKPKAHDITRFNFAARNLDRAMLSELSEADWQKEVDRFIPLMTDAVIEQALAQQPPEIRAISSEKIIKDLKERRKYLAAEVMQYYRFLSEIVSVTGSDKKELFDITRNEDGSVLVQVYKTNKDGEQSLKMYERKFDPAVTKEIRLYGFDGSDKFVVHGSSTRIKVRMIGGDGKDMFENTASAAGKNIIYDRSDEKNTVTGRFHNRMANDTLVNSYKWVYYKYPLFSIFGTLGYNPDDAVYFGPTFKIIKHGFRKTPYKSIQQFRGLFAVSTQAVRIGYHNEFISVLGNNTDIVTDAEYRGPNNTGLFFGYGVNTVYDKTKPDKFKYYRIRYDLGEISLQLRQRFSNQVMLTMGPTFQFFSFDSTDKFNKIRGVVQATPAGINLADLSKKQSYVGARMSLAIDTRNSEALPDKGINWITTIRHLTGANKNSNANLTQLNSDFAVYLSLVPNWLTLANRTGGGINFGDKFEFYQAQYLGSDDNLRGFRKERFAGKSKLYNQTELRLKLANLKTYLFPASFGIFTFFDFGRVWVKNDTDQKLLAGYGGGIWFAPLRKFVLAFSWGYSKEGGIPLFGFGWKF